MSMTDRLETMHYCPTCGAIITGSEPHVCAPQRRRMRHRTLMTDGDMSERCLDCGATRQWNQATKWVINFWRRPTPWMLDGKRQPYCTSG
jgi:hypothetical protein